ncbi:GGDEF domain-containing protein [Roseobacteraceae bacterium S113]
MAVRTWRGVVFFGMCLTVLAMAATWVSIALNYPEDLRDFVRPKAVRSAALIAFPLGSFGGAMLRRSTLLADELTYLVSRDRLTDVATRDFFFKRMDEMPDAYGVSLMIDIDFFKKINDTYGHLTGDKVIAHVAGILNAETRPQDIVCRFGGEEFVVFLAHVDAERGQEVAERLREEIEAQPIDDDGSIVTVTVSIGGSLKAATDEIEVAIKRADEALYRAKETGRNRAIMAPIGNDGTLPLAKSA